MMLRAPGVFRVIAYLSLPFALPAKRRGHDHLPLHVPRRPELVWELFYELQADSCQQKVHSTAEPRTSFGLA